MLDPSRYRDRSAGTRAARHPNPAAVRTARETTLASNKTPYSAAATLVTPLCVNLVNTVLSQRLRNSETVKRRDSTWTISSCLKRIVRAALGLKACGLPLHKLGRGSAL